MRVSGRLQVRRKCGTQIPGAGICGLGFRWRPLRLGQRRASRPAVQRTDPRQGRSGCAIPQPSHSGPPPNQSPRDSKTLSQRNPGPAVHHVAGATDYRMHGARITRIRERPGGPMQGVAVHPEVNRKGPPPFLGVRGTVKVGANEAPPRPLAGRRSKPGRARRVHSSASPNTDDFTRYTVTLSAPGGLARVPKCFPSATKCPRSRSRRSTARSL
jgi:hypothetical protein